MLLATGKKFKSISRKWLTTSETGYIIEYIRCNGAVNVKG